MCVVREGECAYCGKRLGDCVNTNKDGEQFHPGCYFESRQKVTAAWDWGFPDVPAIHFDEKGNIISVGKD